MAAHRVSVLVLTWLASFPAAHAAVTIAFNAPFVGGMSSNLANKDGVVTNGMKWGLIVDTTGNGLLPLYDLVAFAPGSSVVTLTTAGGNPTGDRLILATDLTGDSSQGGVALESDFTTPGGNGGVSGISFALGNGVTAGQSFVLFWVDPSNIRFGALSSAQFLVPSDGQTVTYDQVFLGVDPIRRANSGYVPEPSSIVLGALGALGLLRRRRR